MCQNINSFHVTKNMDKLGVAIINANKKKTITVSLSLLGSAMLTLDAAVAH
jgi:hypothetical protein